jgi:hypothetical protein
LSRNADPAGIEAAHRASMFDTDQTRSVPHYERLQVVGLY